MAKLPNVKSIKNQIYATSNSLREITTLRNELVTIRSTIYQSGSSMLMLLAKSITDGSEFNLYHYGIRDKNQFIDDRQRHLSSEQRAVIEAWQRNGNRPLSEIEKDIENLAQQLEGLKSALPSREKIAEVEAKVDSLCEQLAEKAREFRAPYADLKQNLTDLLIDLPDEMEAVNNARRVSGVISAEIRNLREAYDLEPNGTPYVSQQLSDAEVKSLEVLMGRLVSAVRRGYLPEGSWPLPME